MRGIFEEAFREYGLRQAMRTDNGTRFGSQWIDGMTRMAVW